MGQAGSIQESGGIATTQYLAPRGRTPHLSLRGMSGSLLQQSLRHLSRDPNEMSLAKVLGVGGEPSGSLATHARHVVK